MRRWLLEAPLVIAVMAAWVAAPGLAQANTITPMCTTDAMGQVPCSGGWYTAPVLVSWVWNPIGGSSASPGCFTSQSFSGDTNAVVECDVSWASPPDLQFPYRIKVEISNPTIAANLTPGPSAHGWYNHPVTAAFSGNSFSGIASCTAPVTYAGPDSASASLSGSCTDNAGKSVSANTPFAYDATPPAVSALPSRSPDHNGWYNHPVTFAFGGTDATSGIAGCSTVTYAGPDSGSATVTGACSDRAGNVSQKMVPFRYDATGPSISVSADTADSSASLRWHVGDVAPMASLDVTRSPGLNGSKKSVVYQGDSTGFNDRRVRNDVRYRYTITARDRAGNTSTRTIGVTPNPRLLAPLANARISSPPLLSWTPIRGASYYNVQLYRSGKVLSAWPKHATFQLHGTWKFDGRRFRLKPGRYTWYVWPGFGKRSAARYGRAIGQGTFVVMRDA